MRTSWMSTACLAALAASCGSVSDVQDASKKNGAQVPAATTAAVDDEDDGEDAYENEQVIALDKVPAAVRKAAEEAVPGFVLVSAETETEEGALHYCLEGTAGGEAVEIEVSTDAKVLEIERGEDDEDD